MVNGKGGAQQIIRCGDDGRGDEDLAVTDFTLAGYLVTRHGRVGAS